MESGSQLEVEKKLAKVSYFQDLDPTVIQTLAKSAVLMQYSSRVSVIVEGDKVPGLYIVQSGWLKAFKTGLDGREQVLQILGPGEVFHAIGVFTDHLSPASIITLEDCQLWFIRRDVMQHLLDEQPDLARRVIQDLAGRLLHLAGLVEDLSLRTVEARLAHLLLAQAEGGEILRKRWATQEEIARRLGTAPDVLNRLLRKLMDMGVVQVNRQSIQILDEKRLRDIAGL